MKYAIMVGSNMFIGTNGVLKVEIDGKIVEFFKIREVYNIRSTGSYLAVDCDIKDLDKKREIKLFKNKTVVKDDSVRIETSSKSVLAIRENGETIIKVEQLDINDDSLPKDGPIPNFLKNKPVDAILRITGDFFAGNFNLLIDNESMRVGGITISGNLMIETRGIQLTQMGFSC